MCFVVLDVKSNLLSTISFSIWFPTCNVEQRSMQRLLSKVIRLPKCKELYASVGAHSRTRWNNIVASHGMRTQRTTHLNLLHILSLVNIAKINLLKVYLYFFVSRIIPNRIPWFHFWEMFSNVFTPECLCVIALICEVALNLRTKIASGAIKNSAAS